MKLFCSLWLIVTYSGLTGLGLLWQAQISRANPVFWFLIFQWVIAVGTIWAADLSRSSDVLYVSLFFLSALAFLCGAIFAARTFDLATAYSSFFSKPIKLDAVITRFAVSFLVLLSIGITILYYKAVGYNLFVNLVLGQSVADFTSARLASYSGDQYFAPGYVNQFKNVILPLGLSVIAATAWYSKKRTWFRIVLLVGVPIAVVGLLGTGQRGAFVYAFLALLAGASTLINFRGMHLAVIGSLAVGLFGVMSFALGRIDELSVTSVIVGLLDRMFLNDQEGGLVAFRFIYSLDIAWFSQWIQGFLGVLPGHSGSDFDHYIFYLMHGTARGTSTPTTVASVYYNGGILGILCTYLIIGWMYTYLFYRFLSGPRSILRCFGYGALFFHLAFFVAGAPVSLINKGVVTIFLILVIAKFRISRSPQEQWNISVIGRFHYLD